MAWLQKRPQVMLPATYFTASQNMSIVLVGLGNPGIQYTSTRHNIGFACLDSFIDKFDEMSNWVERKDLKSLFSSGRIGDTQVIAIKPTTFMNLSGEAVSLTLNFYKTQLDHLLVIHDELDVNFGQIRLRMGGADAGHNGVKSIIEKIGEDFGRARIGIGPKTPAQIDSADFVLQKFSDKEEKQMKNLKLETTAILSEYVYAKKISAETRTFIV